MSQHLACAITDAASAWARAETEFFRVLNALAEPWLMAGWGSSPLFPTGLIVLETIGARSAQPRRVPVMATAFDGCVFIGTLPERRLSAAGHSSRVRPDASAACWDVQRCWGCRR